MKKLKDLLIEVASSQSLAQRLKSELAPHLTNRERFENSFISDLEDINYEDYLEEEWEGKRLEIGSQSVKLDIKNWDWVPELEQYKAYGVVEQEKNVKDYFNDLISDLGWHVSSIRKRGKASKSSGIIVVFRKDEGKRVEVTGPLYHVSYKDNKNQILNNGLAPREGKSSKFLYPERVYLFTEYDESLFKRFIIEKANLEVSPEKRMAGSIATPPFSIFKVSLNGLEDVIFYEDRDMEKSIYTTTEIPAKNISFVKDISG